MEAGNPRSPHRAIDREGQRRQGMEVREERLGQDAPEISPREMLYPRVPKEVDVVVRIVDRHREGARVDQGGQEDEGGRAEPGESEETVARRAGFPLRGRLSGRVRHPSRFFGRRAAESSDLAARRRWEIQTRNRGASFVYSVERLPPASRREDADRLIVCEPPKPT